jgi:hypothetical protein
MSLSDGSETGVSEVRGLSKPPPLDFDLIEFLVR